MWCGRAPSPLSRPGPASFPPQVPDFQLEMQWKFQSWIPFLTRLLPHDTVRLTKVGSNVRMDSTLLGIEGLSWLRSDVSMLLYGRDSEEPGACDSHMPALHLPRPRS